jgi:acyl dehydratase
MERAAGSIRARRFEPGVELPELHTGTLTLTDLVRWAAYQENWLRIHYDRDYAQRHLGVRDCVQSGHHRAALMLRTITDWLESDGHVTRFTVRHTAPVFPGDSLRCGGRIRTTEPAAGGVTVQLELWAVRQDGQVASEGTAVVMIHPSGST